MFAQNRNGSADSEVMCFLQGQQLMDLEHKLTLAKEELEKTALDKVSNVNNLSNQALFDCLLASLNCYYFSKLFKPVINK